MTALEARTKSESNKGKLLGKEIHLTEQAIEGAVESGEYTTRYSVYTKVAEQVKDNFASKGFDLKILGQEAGLSILEISWLHAKPL